MSPSVLKVIGLALAGAAAALESNHVLPLGSAAAVSSVLAFILGHLHGKA